MSFEATRRISSERLSEVLIYLNHISSVELPAGTPTGQDLKIVKGMFFVILYGALEKSTHELLQLLLLKIKVLQPKNRHVVLAFNVVSMARRWKSVKDTGYKDVFPRMSEFFSCLDSAEYLGIDETLFAGLLQNIWADTIEEVITALGVSGFTLSNADRAAIDELVENRNAIAHGRESVSSIGERYRSDDLRKKLQDIQSFIVKLIDRMELYFDQREFLLPGDRALY